MSLHDSLVSRSGLPALMHSHATEASVTVVSDDTNVAEDVTAVLGPVEVVDEQTAQGNWLKSLERNVLLLTADLPDDYTNANVLITENGQTESWQIDRIIGKTANGHRLALRKKRGRAKRKPSHYVDS